MSAFLYVIWTHRVILFSVFVKLEDAEMATAAAIKARKGMEMELQDLQSQFEALSKSKQEVCSHTLI